MAEDPKTRSSDCACNLEDVKDDKIIKTANKLEIAKLGNQKSVEDFGIGTYGFFVDISINDSDLITNFITKRNISSRPEDANANGIFCEEETSTINRTPSIDGIVLYIWDKINQEYIKPDLFFLSLKNKKEPVNDMRFNAGTVGGEVDIDGDKYNLVNYNAWEFPFFSFPLRDSTEEKAIAIRQKSKIKDIEIRLDDRNAEDLAIKFFTDIDVHYYDEDVYNENKAANKKFKGEFHKTTIYKKNDVMKIHRPKYDRPNEPKTYVGYIARKNTPTLQNKNQISAQNSEPPLLLNNEYKNEQWIMNWPSELIGKFNRIYENNTNLCNLLRKLETVNFYDKNHGEVVDGETIVFNERYDIWVEFKTDNFNTIITNAMVYGNSRDVTDYPPNDPYKVWVSGFDIYDTEFAAKNNNPAAVPDPVGQFYTTLKFDFNNGEENSLGKLSKTSITIPNVMFFENINWSSNNILDEIKNIYGNKFCIPITSDVKLMPIKRYTSTTYSDICTHIKSIDEAAKPHSLFAAYPDVDAVIASKKCIEYAIYHCPDISPQLKLEIETKLREKVLEQQYLAWCINDFSQLKGARPLKEIKYNEEGLVGLFSNIELKRLKLDTLEIVDVNSEDENAVRVLYREPTKHQTQDFENPMTGESPAELYDIYSLYDTYTEWSDQINAPNTIFNAQVFNLFPYEEDEILQESVTTGESVVTIKRRKLLSKADTIGFIVSANNGQFNTITLRNSTDDKFFRTDITYPLKFGPNTFNNRQQLTDFLNTASNRSIGDLVKDIYKRSDLDKLTSNMTNAKRLRLDFYTRANKNTFVFSNSKSPAILKAVNDAMTLGRIDPNNPYKTADVVMTYAGKVSIRGNYILNDAVKKELAEYQKKPCVSKVKEYIQKLKTERNNYIDTYIRPLENIRDNQFFSISMNNINDFQFTVRVNNLNLECSSWFSGYNLIFDIPRVNDSIRRIYGITKTDLEYRILETGKVPGDEARPKFYNVGKTLEIKRLISSGVYVNDQLYVDEITGVGKFMPRGYLNKSLGNFCKDWVENVGIRDTINISTTFKNGGYYSFTNNRKPKETKNMNLCLLIYILYTATDPKTLGPTVENFKNALMKDFDSILQAKTQGWPQLANFDIEPLLYYEGPPSDLKTPTQINAIIKHYEDLLNIPGATRTECGSGTLGSDLTWGNYEQ